MIFGFLNLLINDTITVDDHLHQFTMITNELEKLGFSPVEVNAYIALIELGGGFVSTIAKKSFAHRVTTYNTLENLVKKGMAKASKKKGFRYYYPINPQVILNQAEDRYKVAKDIVPELLTLQSTYSAKPKIQFFEGVKETSEILMDLLKGEGEVLGFTNYGVGSKIFSEYLDNYYSTARKLKKKFRLLCPNDEYNSNHIKENLQDRIKAGTLEIFAVNPELFPVKNMQYIYEDKVATISLDKDEMIGVIIESKSNAETSRSIFNLAWLGATSFVAK
jgi:sugar-specific transcriptional regulator TrmB